MMTIYYFVVPVVHYASFAAQNGGLVSIIASNIGTDANVITVTVGDLPCYDVFIVDCYIVSPITHLTVAHYSGRLALL